MTPMLGRRAFLWVMGGMLTHGFAGCAKPQKTVDAEDTADVEDARPSTDEAPQQEEAAMQITVTVNDVPFVATIEDTAAGQELLSRLPLALSMNELHGNEKYCYTGEAFGGESYVPETIEAGDLMVYGSDCLVLFYESFANGGWSYQRVGRIDDPSGLVDACGGGTVEVTLEPVV